MLRTRPLLPALAIAALLPVLPAKATATPVPLQRDAPFPLSSPDHGAFRSGTPDMTRPLARVRLLTAELAFLPPGHLVTRTIAPPHARNGAPPAPVTELLVLPLPAALPLFAAALLGFLVIARRRRHMRALAGAKGTA